MGLLATVCRLRRGTTRASPEAGSELPRAAGPEPAAMGSAAAWHSGPDPGESAASVAASPRAGPRSIRACPITTSRARRGAIIP
jgi:hypothetical protein